VTKSIYRRAAIGAAIAAVCVAYLLASLTYGRTLRSTASPSGFQALVAEAFLDGHLDLWPAPTGLTELEDPYDPTANIPYRNGGHHDLVLYDGKIYSVTGPTPVLLTNVPYRLLGLGYLNANLATLGFCMLGFLAAAACYFECRRRFYPSSPLWFDLAAVASIGAGSPVAWLISIGRSYEAAIACGFMLMALSAYLLLRGFRDPEHPKLYLATLGSAAAAAAVGARPHLAVLAAFVATAGFLVWRHVPDRRKRSQALLALAAPYVALGLLLAWYNYARFDSVSEFGTTYQLAGYNMPAYPAYRLGYLWPNVKDYLFASPRIESKWPYIHLQLITYTGNPGRHEHEPVAGAAWLFPSIILGFAMLLSVPGRLTRQFRGLRQLVMLGSGVALLSLIAVSFPFNSSTMRYSVDFAPLLVLAATVAAAGAMSTASTTARRVILGSLWLVASAAGALAGLALVLTRCPGTGSC
jgi:hypothetical protein